MNAPWTVKVNFPPFVTLDVNNARTFLEICNAVAVSWEALGNGRYQVRASDMPALEAEAERRHVAHAKGAARAHVDPSVPDSERLRGVAAAEPTDAAILEEAARRLRERSIWAVAHSGSILVYRPNARGEMHALASGSNAEIRVQRTVNAVLVAERDAIATWMAQRAEAAARSARIRGLHRGGDDIDWTEAANVGDKE